MNIRELAEHRFLGHEPFLLQLLSLLLACNQPFPPSQISYTSMVFVTISKSVCCANEPQKLCNLFHHICNREKRISTIFPQLSKIHLHVNSKKHPLPFATLPDWWTRNRSGANVSANVSGLIYWESNCLSRIWVSLDERPLSVLLIGPNHSLAL